LCDPLVLHSILSPSLDHSGDSCPRCPELWMGYGDSCYLFSKERKDWNSSQESCAAESARLLVISSTQEMVSMTRLLHCFGEASAV
uniref:Uncharacterized protein n=1 Tax=Crocodylus porosus TaxID=8502 RepID=A0A7M4F3C0_CROPO